MDFTLSKYRSLLKSLQDNGYQFITFYDYLTQNHSASEPAVRQSVNQPARQEQVNQSTERTLRARRKAINQNSQLTARNPQPVTQNSQPATQNSELLIILRHDVDQKPQNSLATAKIENELGIKGSYYFRMIPEKGTQKTRLPDCVTQAGIKRIFADFFTMENNASESKNRYNPKIFNSNIVKEIVALGHEIGYHYETMDTSSTRHRDADVFVSRSDLLDDGEKDYFVVSSKKDKTPRNEELIDAAYQLFLQNLEKFRQIADIKTICMHGSPHSKYDNREIWKKYSYRDLGIIGEPYFDIDFNDFFYLTDTGRRWDGHRVSVRDKMPQQGQWNCSGLRFHSTSDIINAACQNRLPNRIMITVHPQRWTNKPLPWAKELVWQNIKNVVKAILVKGN